jgi:predicted nucleic acid-binding protein
LILEGHRAVLPTLVLYEWLRGPRTAEEIAAQEAWMPRSGAVSFGVPESELAAQIFQSSSRARTRQVDFAIAATAIVRELPLWTLNRDDFADIPRLRLLD